MLRSCSTPSFPQFDFHTVTESTLRLKALLALGCLLILSGCATTRTPIAELTPDELKTRLQHGSVSVRPITTPVKLVERTKGQAVGNFLLASVVSSAASSGAGARTVGEMQANTQIGQTFGQELNRALPTGVESESEIGVEARLAKRLSERFTSAPDGTPDNPIELVVSASRWELGYESFLASSDYTLSYALGVAMVEPSKEAPKILRRVFCQGQVPEKMPLDAWKADEHAALRKAADEIAEQCFRKTLSALGME